MNVEPVQPPSPAALWPVSGYAARQNDGHRLLCGFQKFANFNVSLSEHRHHVSADCLYLPGLPTDSCSRIAHTPPFLATRVHAFNPPTHETREIDKRSLRHNFLLQKTRKKNHSTCQHTHQLLLLLLVHYTISPRLLLTLLV